MRGVEKLDPEAVIPLRGSLAGCSRRYQYVSSVMCPGSLRR
jgi:hypothetical protein